LQKLFICFDFLARIARKGIIEEIKIHLISFKNTGLKLTIEQMIVKMNSINNISNRLIILVLCSLTLDNRAKFTPVIEYNIMYKWEGI
jgi:hypothetical protein